jgi:hypothetical protein
MKIYLDTEFLEGTQKRSFLGLRFGSTRPMIELISVGLVSERGILEYYGVSNEFNLNEAWERYDVVDRGVDGKRVVFWIRDNVLKPLFDELVQIDLKQCNPFPAKMHRFTKLNLERLLNEYGKTRREIAWDIQKFVMDCWQDQIKTQESLLGKPVHAPVGEYARQHGPVRFCGYYSDYDWVVFCQLFGKMIDLPKGFPMYCYDLKQAFDDKVRASDLKSDFDYASGSQLSFNQKVEFYKSRPEYPKNPSEHSAIHDARWNRSYDFFINNHIK